MAKNLAHRITAISMALLMLLSSTGFSMDAHFCQDRLKGISLFGVAKSCHDTQATPPCAKTKKTCQHQKNGISQADKYNCCHNESIVVIEKSDVDATSSQMATLQDIQLDFVAAFASVYILKYNLEVGFQPFDQYKPPLLDRDVQLLYQSFLI